ncbi:uncharacterized protein LOC128651773 [Bombina bombina]|uniref:uncharacterized protein LOC128639569 n=1 Tax=Bombina bombina TaxID=8345 RepID=UPI00235A9193|nr:uncharacterized protein LOC128639569 [Bombina bombina]XP_053552375.1 uncharacterized protein LOC128643558 [Bombina bombina]XP_053560735.1 uncharacterized protein LOC128651773 [Bombina bombina]
MSRTPIFTDGELIILVYGMNRYFPRRIGGVRGIRHERRDEIIYEMMRRMRRVSGIHRRRRQCLRRFSDLRRREPERYTAMRSLIRRYLSRPRERIPRYLLPVSHSSPVSNRSSPPLPLTLLQPQGDEDSQTSSAMSENEDESDESSSSSEEEISPEACPTLVTAEEEDEPENEDDSDAYATSALSPEERQEEEAESESETDSGTEYAATAEDEVEKKETVEIGTQTEPSVTQFRDLRQALRNFVEAARVLEHSLQNL